MCGCSCNDHDVHQQMLFILSLWKTTIVISSGFDSYFYFIIHSRATSEMERSTKSKKNCIWCLPPQLGIFQGEALSPSCKLGYIPVSLWHNITRPFRSFRCQWDAKCFMCTTSRRWQTKAAGIWKGLYIHDIYFICCCQRYWMISLLHKDHVMVLMVSMLTNQHKSTHPMKLVLPPLFWLYVVLCFS